MKRIFMLSALPIVALGMLAFSFNTTTTSVSESEIAGKVKWMTWEEAVEANKKEPKKIFVDVYTDWCGWCKRMDKTTFVDDKVVAKLGSDFYAVKLDAEMKREVNFNGHVFKFVNQGRRGVHTLAYSLLNGKMSYPSYVFLNEKFERILISPGYQPANDFIKVLKYTAGEHYQNTSWNDFLAKNKK